MSNILAIINNIYFLYRFLNRYTSAKNSVAPPSNVQSHNMCTYCNSVIVEFHSVITNTALLFVSINLIPVSNSLLVPFGFNVPTE